MQLRELTLEQRRKLLNDACMQLKQQFVGIDNIIDEVADILLPWWLYPEYQMRPLIINLWGMTGSGKTELIKQFAEFLNYKNLLLRFDMGEFGNNSQFLKYTLTGQLEQFNGLAPMIVLDEFQFAKTKDENGKEVNNTSLRVIWDLLDSGQLMFEPSVNTYYVIRLKRILNMLKILHKNGAEFKHGIFTKLASQAYEMISSISFGYTADPVPEDGSKPPVKHEEVLLLDLFCTGYAEVVTAKNWTWLDIRDMLRQIDSLPELINRIADDLEGAIALRKMDLSKSVIFVVGNLDEAYSMSHNINPDIDADEFRRHTLKINIADIKSALQHRFRNEQIARLGNNHLIYHAFSHANFEELIEMHLNKTKALVKQRFNVDITFTKPVKELLYAEGVFPTQGVRPVISTIRNHIESNIAKVMLHIPQNSKRRIKIVWDFNGGKFNVQIVGVKSIKIPVVQKINSLRVSTKSDLQAIVAVHESGHTLAAMFAAKIVPEYVITRTVDSDSQGFAYTILPEEIITKRLLLDKIKLFLGGFAAEQVIFGKENNTTGVWDDFNKATQIVHQMLRDYGMNDLPYKLNIHEYGGNPYQFTYTTKEEEAGIAIMYQCLDEVKEILVKERAFFLQLAKYLSNNSRIDKPEIIAMYLDVCKKQKRKPQSFVTKDTYYNFRKRLMSL